MALQMIITTSPSKPFTFNMKGFPRRVAITQEYKAEIDSLYAKVEETFQTGVTPPAQWDKDGVLGFVRRVVHSVLHQQPADDADLFHHGCDR